MINDILCDFLHKFVHAYLDDVCIYNRTLEEHMEDLRLVVERFKQEGLKLRLKKCFFGLYITPSIHYSIIFHLVKYDTV
jgi:hypothetical protein